MSNETVTIECKLVNRRRDRSAICITEGSTVTSPFTGAQVAVSYWIQTKHIEDHSPADLEDVAIGDSLEIEIPEWLALEKGLI